MAETITVLLVDEDTDVLELTKTFLEREDDAIEVTTETSAPDALERLESEPFDCVVSDYSMPSMSGIEFLQEVRERVPGLPFFFFTGKDREEIKTETDDIEIAGHIQKGTGTERYSELAKEIRAAVERS
ncbi:response regulator [Halapricum hydrolyticum]|uniref:Response regulator n=1 Tax=Halapricum hydrolyticum TaxID=2979991 RepID=A0AAE3IBU1_9EURY|nr:response regulator [Halapricum hydrolyticum]MCU4716736.1 response regulator [Halapricum hydrolyticum]MCU4725659.1 response regulator [Halapricum hydrolyticum]